jgi:hypothetical protein
MSPVSISYWAEGPTDRAVARKLIYTAGAVPGPDYGTRRRAAPGKDYLDLNLGRFNRAAHHSSWLVLRDSDGDCASELAGRLLPSPARNMCFRLVVPAIEAWLMADRRALADFLAVAVDRIPGSPEEIDNAKGRLLEVARHSRSRSIREDFLPAPRSGRREGPGYASGLIGFINDRWDPARACDRADSLRRCIGRLGAMVARG